MDDKKPKEEQERSSDKPQYFWGFNGRDFIKRPNSKVYEPICYRPNGERNNDPPIPPSIRIRRDFLDLASVITGWAISLATLLVLALYTYYTRGQWHELIKATNASSQASQTAACALAENERQFGLMFGEIQKQTGAQVRSGTAAKNAADTAKDALHVSERAYVILGIPVDDFQRKRTNIPIINSGHIPSGPAKIVTHEVTFRVDDPSARSIQTEALIERHWMMRPYASIPVVPSGSLTAVEVHLPAIDQDELTNGKKGLIIAAMVTYNDGFPNTPDQLYFFCDQSSYVPETKLFAMRPCEDARLMVSLLEKADEYPGEKYKEK